MHYVFLLEIDIRALEQPLVGHPPYDSLRFDVPVLREGDVNARVWIRAREVEQSLSLIDQILTRLPEGPLRAKADPVWEPREGMAIVEGFRGDVLVWLSLRYGRIERCHLRDPASRRTRR
jgi:Ni,Fe-hydrogenase III large subunit